MFDVHQRDDLRQALLTWAQLDTDIVAAGLVGSAARGEADRWSDIDLAFRLDPGANVNEVAERFTDSVRQHAYVVDTLDIAASGGLYRVFLLGTGLQVDLSFFPYDAFRATGGEVMQLHFGTAVASEPAPKRDWRRAAALSWLFLLHARSALGRERWWQAELMLAELRSQLFWLAAYHAGLTPDHGRNAHKLPEEVTAVLSCARARSVAPAELRRSYTKSLRAYAEVVGLLDRQLADRVVASFDR